MSAPPVPSGDARIPVTVVTEAAALSAALAGGRAAAVLAEAPAPPLPPGAAALAGFDPVTGPHPVACACCGGGRPPAAAALDRLFQARARGQVPWFDRVVALAGTEAARRAVTEALRRDRVTAARFRRAAAGEG